MKRHNTQSKSKRILKVLSLGTTLGWQDLKNSYRRSRIGPFWLTIGMGVQILAIGLVFGILFGTPINEFLPFLAVSLIVWNFLSSSILDGSLSFVSGESIVRQLPLPHYVHVVRSLWKNTLMLGHNIVILPIVFLVFLKEPNWKIVLLIPGFFLASSFLFSATYVLGLVTARFRDMQPIAVHLMTVFFYVTPVIWQPDLIPSNTAQLLLGLNPFYHLMQVIRMPILGQEPTFLNWTLAALTTVVAGLVSLITAKKYRDRLAYWV